MKKIILIIVALGFLLGSATAQIYISEAFVRAEANGDVFARVECVNESGNQVNEDIWLTIYPAENWECDLNESTMVSIKCNDPEDYFHTISEGPDTYCAEFEYADPPHSDTHRRFFVVPREINVQTISESRPLTALFSALTALGIAVGLKKKK